MPWTPSARIAFRVVDPRSGVQLPDGMLGELHLQGYNVMEGYLNDPHATAQALTGDGWLRTGDMAIADGHAFTRIPSLRRRPPSSQPQPGEEVASMVAGMGS